MWIISPNLVLVLRTGSPGVQIPKVLSYLNIKVNPVFSQLLQCWELFFCNGSWLQCKNSRMKSTLFKPAVLLSSDSDIFLNCIAVLIEGIQFLLVYFYFPFREMFCSKACIQSCVMDLDFLDKHLLNTAQL